MRLIMNDKEMLKKYNELAEKVEKLPVGSEERLDLEIEMVDIEEWLPGGEHDYMGY